MAETTQETSSDTSRKKKRRDKSKKDDELDNFTTESGSIDPVALLKSKIEEAKAAKDFKGAQILREHLWTFRDTGIIEPGVLDIVQPPSTTTCQTITTGNSSTKETATSITDHVPPTTNDSTSSMDDNMPTAAVKSLNKLEKKLKAIQELKKKKSKGIKLEANQRAKIGTEDELKKEMEMLRKIINGES